MKIKAIERFSNHLTIGRVYVVLDETDMYYYISNDQGVMGGYRKGRFIKVNDAPAAAMLLPSDAAERKGLPITTGVLDYFPLALAEVAKLSKVGNDQHNPGQPLHWDKSKSTDHADTIARHLIDRGRLDADGMRHSAKLAWRALALLQTELEASNAIAA